MKTKETSTYKTKGLEFYITNAESIDHAVKSFIHYRINVTRNDIELFEGELPKQANVMSAIMPAVEDNSTKSSRELALEWWNEEPNNYKIHLCGEYFIGRSFRSLTGREIEEIYDKEILESKRQDEWQEFQVNQRYSKPNKKKFKEFNPELFKAYINKFSDDDKLKALSIILDSFENLSVGSRNATSEDENYSALVLYSGTKELLEYKTRVW